MSCNQQLVNDILSSIKLWLFYLLFPFLNLFLRGNCFKDFLKRFCFGFILIKKINVTKLQNVQFTFTIYNCSICKYIPFWWKILNQPNAC